ILRTHAGHVSGRQMSLLVSARQRLERTLRKLIRIRLPVIAIYAVAALVMIVLGDLYLGREIFPRVTSNQLLLRLRAPTGTRVEATEQLYLDVTQAIERTAGPGNVVTTLGYVGAPPPNYPINTIYLWTSGQHEAVLRVALKPNSGIRVNEFEERLRRDLSGKFPGCQFSFEAADIVTQIMNFGAPTPVEINISGPDLAADPAFAEKLRAEVVKIGGLRDLQY